MLRRFAFSFAAGSVAVIALASSASAQSYTTRIEPRPFYGATVTLEEGVRVIRPLPPERHVIINPEGSTPLALGFNETRVYENRTIRNYNYSDGPRYVGRSGYGAGGGILAPGYGSGAKMMGHGPQGGVSAGPSGH